MSTTTFRPAPELAERARKLIAKHHRHLAEVSILYVWRDKATRSQGSLVYGTASRLTGRSAMLLAAAIEGGGDVYGVELDDEDDHHRFVIEIAGDVWLLMNDKERDALLDHELSHCRIDDEGRLRIVGADVHEFAGVVKRHGLWRESLQQFVEEASAQLTLELDDADS